MPLTCTQNIEYMSGVLTPNKNKKGNTTMKMITRTISERRYTVMCLNITTAEVTHEDFSMGSMSFPGQDAALRALQKKYNTDEKKLVAITATSSVDALYAMTEEAFIKNAIPVKDVKEAREYFKAHGEEVEEV